MYVLGVDASLTSTGLAWLDTDEPEWSTSRVRTGPGSDPVRGTWQRMEHIASEVGVATFGGDGSGVLVDLVVIEGLATYGHNAGVLAGLWWQIVGRIVWSDVELLIVPPAVNKKYATGRGNATKSDVLAQVRDTYPAADVPQHDVADAVALAALGARVKGFPVEQVARPWVEEVAAAVAAREAAREL